MGKTDELTTGQVADLLTAELGREITEPRINALLRRPLRHLRPPIIRGRRRWRSEDVNRLREAIMERTRGVAQ